MRIKDFDWNDDNIEHIAEHNVETYEVEEIFPQKFKNIEEERLFRSTHDITEYLDELEEINEPIELDPELEKNIKARHRRRKLLNIRSEK